MFSIRSKWLWASLSAAALIAAGPGLGSTAWAEGAGHGGGGGGGGHGGGGGSGGRGGAGFSSGGRSAFAGPSSSSTGHSFAGNSVAPSSFGRTGTVGATNTARGLTNSNSIQAGQVHNGMVVHSVNRLGQNANNLASNHLNANNLNANRNANWNGNGNWNRNGFNRDHFRNGFFFGGLPFFWYWPFPFWGLGWYPWWGGYGGYGYGNAYYADNWVTPPPAVAAAPELQMPQVATARVEVFLPDPNAQVLLDGNKTSSTGTVRYYETPPLQPGKEYQYTITATWMKDGKPVSGELKVGLMAGKVTVADFTTPQEQGPPPKPPQEIPPNPPG